MSRQSALRNRGCLSLLLVGLITSAANAQVMPTTKAGFYQTGERFAECSAYFAHVAQFARDGGRPKNATAVEEVERRWRIAGLFLLTEGLDQSRKGEAQELFANLQAAKVDQLRASRGLPPEAFVKIFREYQDDCVPWADLQESISTATPSGPPTER